MATTGKELKLERVAADVAAKDLAERMGVSRSTVWIIEKAASVDDDRAFAYRYALATFKDVATPSTGEAA